MEESLHRWAVRRDFLYFPHSSNDVGSSPASVQTRYKLLIYQRCEPPASRCIYSALDRHGRLPLVEVRADQAVYLSN